LDTNTEIPATDCPKMERTLQAERLGLATTNPIVIRDGRRNVFDRPDLGVEID